VTAEDAPAVSLRGVSKRFGSVEAIDELTLDIARGEVFGLLGPNGAGKTTTIGLLLGLIAPSAGKVRVFGFDPGREPLKVRTHTGIVLQHPSLDPYLSGWENLQLYAGLYPMSASAQRQRVAEALAWAGLSEAAERLVHTYSGGMKRRLDLAISLLHHPPLLLLDEPTLGLDVATRQQLWSLIAALKARGLTVLLTTHYLEEANRLCDRIGILHQGRLVALDTPQGLRQRVLGERYRLSVTVRRIPVGIDLPLEPQRSGERLVFSGPPKLLWRVLAVLQHHCEDDLLEVFYEQPTLDEVFLALTTAKEPRCA
jgi:ABC-2 type transport system ATP-binding protein